MITIINQKHFDPDHFVNLDLSENIILATNQDKTEYIRENLDGSLSIKLDHAVNLLGERTYTSDGNLVNITYLPRIKIACPRGLIINFFEPINSNFIFKMNNTYDIHQYFFEEGHVLRTTLPNVIVYENFKIEIIIDLHRLKLNRNIYKINKNESILSFKFDHIYYPGETNMKQIKNMYWFQHNEIFNNFKKNI